VRAYAQKASPVSSHLAHQIRFENRQKASQVGFILNNGTTPDKPLIDSTLGVVALFDFDNDGFLDIFFYNRLCRNNRDGTFTDVTERAGLRGEKDIPWQSLRPISTMTAGPTSM
jgi:hypothetical protein